LSEKFEEISLTDTSIKKMVKVISFTIFGGLKKYCLGLLKNIELAQEHLPDYKVWIYAGNDVPEDYIKQYKSFSNVKIHTCR